MARIRLGRLFGAAVLAAGAGTLALSPGWAQGAKAGGAAAIPPTFVTIEQPDAERTKAQLSELLRRYPPSLPGALGLDPSLLGNEVYLAPYPALVDFLGKHPEIARNPSFYVGDGPDHRTRDLKGQVLDMWRDALISVTVFTGFGIAFGVLFWLTRTIIDYRRWSRLAKVQTDVHTKILDRFTANEDLLSYIQSPAGSKFLESSPIKLDAGPRTVGAPLSRILWSVQGGVVLLAAGIGLMVVSARLGNDAAQPVQAFGVLGVALGLGFVVSAVISFAISRRLGLIEAPPEAPRTEPAVVEGLGLRK